MRSVSTATPLQPIVDLLHEMQTLIERLDDVDYTMPAPGRSSSAIGGHVRHCLDHVNAVIAATHTGVCAYDRRVRGTDVEADRRAAVRAIAHVIAVVQCLDQTAFDREIDVESQLDRSGTTMTTRSTIGRELVYVMSHTIHHNAIVSMMLRSRGVATEPHFGLAPSTPDRS
jgi:uncharacterized damage-inducible protein DinB